MVDRRAEKTSYSYASRKKDQINSAIDMKKSSNRCAQYLLRLLACVAGCAVSVASDPALSQTHSAKDSSISSPDSVLESIQSILRHGHLEDNDFVSRALNVRLVGGELESGKGDMVYQCTMQLGGTVRNWTGRRYRYDDIPDYMAQPHWPPTSKCFNPYVIDEKNPKHIAASLGIALNVNNVCITLDDVKKYFPSAYYQNSRGGYGVLYGESDSDNRIVLRIGSTRTGKICAIDIVLDQNEFSPTYY